MNPMKVNCDQLGEPIARLKVIKDAIKYLGVVMMTNLVPKMRFQDRAAKGTRQVERLNSIVVKERREHGMRPPM